jgi:hypothetical protein
VAAVISNFRMAKTKRRFCNSNRATELSFVSANMGELVPDWFILARMLLKGWFA